MRKYIALGTIAAMALGAQTAAAEGFSYNLVEGSYAFADIEGTDGDGFGVKGSAELTSLIHVFGGVEMLGFDGGLDLDTMNLGVGLDYGLSDSVDLVGGVSLERMKLSGGGSVSETGYGVSGGVRGKVMENLELSAGLKFADVGDFGDSFTYSAGARWYFTPNLAAGVNYNKLDLGDLDADGDEWVISVRYDFGNRK